MRAPGYTIHWPIRYDGVPRAPIRRGGWKITASVDGAAAEQVIDGDPWTYWSVPAEIPAPSITLDLGRLATVNGVFLDGGERDHDGFVRLRVESSADGTRLAPREGGRGGLAALLRAQRSNHHRRPHSPGRAVPSDDALGSAAHAPRRGPPVRVVHRRARRLRPRPEGVAFVEPEFADPTSPSSSSDACACKASANLRAMRPSLSSAVSIDRSAKPRRRARSNASRPRGFSRRIRSAGASDAT